MAATELVDVPSYDQLMWPTLQALKAMGGSASNDELLSKVIEMEDIPEDVASIMHSDDRSTKLEYRLAWARTYLRMAGAVENSARGVWTTTDLGENLSPEHLQDLYAKTLLDIRAQRGSKRKKAAHSRSASDMPEDADCLPEDNWKDDLLARLKQLSPDAFERLAQRMLREAGFIRVEVTGRSGDGGIDGLGVLRLNLLSFHVLFQCKRYQGSVGAGQIRDFRGAMIGRSDKGLFITTGTFTSDAKKEATRDGAPPVELIDGDLLCDHLKQLRLGVAVEMVEKVTLQKQWFDQI